MRLASQNPYPPMVRLKAVFWLGIVISFPFQAIKISKARLTNLRFELFCTFFGDFGDKYPQGLLKLMEIVGLLK